ncbi:hypothetical protein NDU88_001266 [Pleurodeles waltl]|uniref:Uncharacterized protein n=1 Tax=Pleurodeles waltl TaxID=8319 RepID=A0AAV7L9A5_PLEWA|nr:hypothetical protein NDU88_001266 [Pleurodeles waltl]
MTWHIVVVLPVPRILCGRLFVYKVCQHRRTLSRDSTYDREKRLEGRRWRRIQRARPPVVIHVSRYATKTLNTRLMSYFVFWQRRRQETSESIPLRNEGVEYASYVESCKDSRTLSRDSTYDREKRLEGRLARDVELLNKSLKESTKANQEARNDPRKDKDLEGPIKKEWEGYVGLSLSSYVESCKDSRTLSRDSTYEREKRLEGRRWRSHSLVILLGLRVK